MVKISRRTQAFILIAAIVLVVHFYFQLLYKPLQKGIRDMRFEKEEVESEFADVAVEATDIETIKAQYDKQYKKFTELEQAVHALEAVLPSHKEMSSLLDHLTQSLDKVKGEFVSLQPTLERAGQGDAFDALSVEIKFYADFTQIIEYLKILEGTPILLGVQSIDMELDEEVSTRPFTQIQFSTFLSGRHQAEVKRRQKKTESKEKKAAEKKGEVLEEMVRPEPVQEPFHPEAKPYDQRLPGDHRLRMIVWRGAKPAALIDGKVMKEGSMLDNRVLSKIEPEGVWFLEEGIQYYLALEG